VAVISEDDIAVSLVTVSSMCWCESSLDIAGMVATSLTVGDVVVALDEASSCGVAFVAVVSLVVGDAMAALENALACDAAYVATSEGAASYSLTTNTNLDKPKQHKIIKINKQQKNLKNSIFNVWQSRGQCVRSMRRRVRTTLRRVEGRRRHGWHRGIGTPVDAVEWRVGC